ncbi:MAG: heme exporter protein CcmB [Phyllobacteriaceae bacterium]|nr:heme exporter protein CcmB [Phyllobacteriaceae bacterium]
MSPFITLMRRDLTLMFRQGGGLGAALSFMLAFIVMIPLAIGPDQATLARLAPGLMWLALLLAILLTTERMFQQDHEDGSLDLLNGASLPLELVCLAKALSHWLAVGLPLAVLAAPLGILLNLATSSIIPLMLAMITGSVALSLMASIAGAVTAGLRRGGLVVPLLVLPLYVPVLIFGIAASTGDLGPSGNTPALLVLLAIALVAIVIQPWAAAAALRAYFR